jgi:hypothetical protein
VSSLEASKSAPLRLAATCFCYSSYETELSTSSGAAASAMGDEGVSPATPARSAATSSMPAFATSESAPALKAPAPFFVTAPWTRPLPDSRSCSRPRAGFGAGLSRLPTALLRRARSDGRGGKESRERGRERRGQKGETRRTNRTPSAPTKQNLRGVPDARACGGVAELCDSARTPSLRPSRVATHASFLTGAVSTSAASFVAFAPALGAAAAA